MPTGTSFLYLSIINIDFNIGVIYNYLGDFMIYNNILFDLDGTLTDPKIGITKSVSYALKAYGIETENLDSLCKFIGPPLVHSFKKYYGFNDADCTKLVDIYREYFSVTGKFENEVYPLIPEMLAAMKNKGYRLFVATGKPEKFAKEILEHFGLSKYFECIRGIALDEEHITKAEVISRVLKKYSLDKKSTVMIGDRCFDIEGAKETGIDGIGVTYGYGDRTELENAGAKYIINTTKQLKEFFEV